MKKFGVMTMMMISLFASASSAMAKDIATPRAIPGAVSANDQAALKAVLADLIKEYEEPVRADDLTVYDTEEDNSPCQLAAGGRKLECHLDYLNDRWNGNVDATFSVKAGKVVELTEISF